MLRKVFIRFLAVHVRDGYVVDVDGVRSGTCSGIAQFWDSSNIYT